MNNIRKHINLIESILEDTGTVELTNYTIEDKDKLQKLVNRAWPNVSYKGLPILDGDNSYYDQLDYAVKSDKRYDARFNSHAQEVYLGYNIVNDVFYSGYDGDPWEDPHQSDYYGDDEEEGIGSALFTIKVIDGKLKIIDHESHYDLFYQGPYSALKGNPNIVHLRLD